MASCSPESATAHWLDRQDFSGYLEARELLEDGRCTPQCLLACEPGGERECACRCRGQYHGALISALVPAEPKRPWYARYCGWAQMHLDERCPVIPGGTEAFNRHYRAAKIARVPFAAVQRRADTWEMHFDSETEEYDSALSEEAADVWEEVVSAVISARRAGNGCGGKSLLFVRRVRTQAEAQVLGTIALELLCGNLDGARSCLRALTEDRTAP